MIKELQRPSDVVKKLLKYTRLKIAEENIDITLALNRISSKDVLAERDIPESNKSVLDGYATYYKSIIGATSSSPVKLRVTGKARVDEKVKVLINPGEAIEVATGTMLPEQLDVVVPLEYTMREGDIIYVMRSLPKYYGISIKGEDIKKGEKILEKGEIIRPWHVGLLAAQGFREVKVYKRLRAAIFDTGNELVEPGQSLPEGKIYDSTRYIVRSYLEDLGLEVIDYGIVGDDEYKIKSMFEKALAEADIVFSIGGTSVGKRDYTVRVLSGLQGLEYFVHGLSLTPGRPAAVAVVSGKPVFALSGMPVAALSELHILFRDFLVKMLGIKGIVVPKVKAQLTRRVVSEPGMLSVFRVKVCRDRNGAYYAEPLRLTGSGLLSTLIRGNGLLIVGEDVTGIEEGELIEVEIIGEIKEC